MNKVFVFINFIKSSICSGVFLFKCCIERLLFPYSCLSCGVLLQGNNVKHDKRSEKLPLEERFFCKKCLLKVNVINNKYCKKCGYPLKTQNFLDKQITKCYSCEKYNPIFTMARSCYEYKGVIRKLLLHFKFYFNTDYLTFIGQSMYKKYKEELHKADIVCFVPITNMKLFFKGFNHSGLIAKAFIEEAKKQNDNLYLINDFFIKTKKTTASKKMSQLERLYKKHYFSINQKYLMKDKINLNYKNVLIIDDIMTTGGTLNAISSLIKNEYPKANIECLTFARTMLY